MVPATAIRGQSGDVSLNRRGLHLRVVLSKPINDIAAARWVLQLLCSVAHEFGDRAVIRPCHSTVLPLWRARRPVHHGLTSLFRGPIRLRVASFAGGVHQLANDAANLLVLLLAYLAVATLGFALVED